MNSPVFLFARNLASNALIHGKWPRACKLLENADVQLFVHMPQHDHRMPGGHGPANDPDVKGLALMPDDQGRYRVNTVDFSMPGAWLLNVVVKNGDKTLNTYFAPKVGEE